jgi:methylated-DNA-[protein]-cysteine S-methyltransferase
MVFNTTYESPIGRLLLASDDSHLIGLWIEGQKYFADALPKDTIIANDNPVLSAAADWLEKYFAGMNPDVSSLSLAPAGSEFRRSVWEMLSAIPYGETTTYGALAKEIARLTGKTRMSAQAVGGAISHNPISIIIPCHRVIGMDGSLTGYAAGTHIKAKLLEHEGCFVRL